MKRRTMALILLAALLLSACGAQSNGEMGTADPQSQGASGTEGSAADPQSQGASGTEGGAEDSQSQGTSGTEGGAVDTQEADTPGAEQNDGKELEAEQLSFEASEAVDVAATPVYPETRTNETLSEEYLAGLRSFTDQITGEVLAGLSGNACFSPISLYFPLAMTAVGAKGETLAELSALLGTQGLDEATVLAETQKLFQSLYRNVKNEEGEGQKLLLANSLWLKKDVRFDQSFLDKGATYFYQALFQTDFANPDTPGLMSAWISDNTNGLLKPQIQIPNPEQALLYLLNTLYFKAAWQESFLKNDSTQEDFTLADGSTVTADYLNHTKTSSSYKLADDYTSYTLFLQGGYDIRVTFLLPDESISPRELLAAHGIEELLTVAENNEARRVSCKLPKFDFMTTIPLNDAVKALGVTQAFGTDADFSGMIAAEASDIKPYISQILQETKIAIDEEGIEGAAYTMIAMNTTSMIMEPPLPLSISFDRPFLFAVHTEEGVVLFAGVVDDPTIGAE